MKTPPGAVGCAQVNQGLTVVFLRHFYIENDIVPAGARPGYQDKYFFMRQCTGSRWVFSRMYYEKFRACGVFTMAGISASIAENNCCLSFSRPGGCVLRMDRWTLC
jgi:hypothetical protein